MRDTKPSLQAIAEPIVESNEKSKEKSLRISPVMKGI